MSATLDCSRFQTHGGFSFVGPNPANAEPGGHGIQESARTRRRQSVDPSLELFHQQTNFDSITVKRGP